jgi:hypothetical protein
VNDVGSSRFTTSPAAARSPLVGNGDFVYSVSSGLVRYSSLNKLYLRFASWTSSERGINKLTLFRRFSKNPIVFFSPAAVDTRERLAILSDINRLCEC